MYKHSTVTEQIIKAFYHVYNELGHGFLEKVYENAMVIQLQKQGLVVRQQAAIKVYFDERIVGVYFADLLVDNKVIVEIKVAEALCEDHEAQLLHYLKATDIDVGLLLNFGPRPQVKRKIFEKARTGRFTADAR
ncbi:MAG TPA: GxxExxY protein [Blastocatellia bacterium]|nr:GxxExxY protein [Blastocatellia bacterium]